MSYKILVLNLGSTSTKIAYYINDKEKVKENIHHPDAERIGYKNIWEEFNYRLEKVNEFIEKHDIELNELDAIISRGGHTHPLEGGVYEVNEAMLQEQASGKWGIHASDLGSKMAYEMCKDLHARPLIADPPITDEFEDIARVSGLSLIERRSSFHALSQKATARRYAREVNKNYEDLRLIVVHLGGGISVAPHYYGKMIDGDNALEGDGCFSTNRSGGLPVGDLVRLCFSGKYTYDDVHKMINGKGGLVSYLGTSDVKEIEMKSKTDPKYKFYLEAMIYQVCKEIGAMSTVLEGRVDQILLTGGMAFSNAIVKAISKKTSFIAPITVYAGENEMFGLASAAYEALKGSEEIKKFV